jgi:hypothetical protein
MGRIKSLEEIKAEVRAHTGKKKIFRRAKKEDVESVLANLTTKDPDLWAAEWSRVAKPYEDQGARHEQAGRFDEARAAYLQSYTYYATGRYPVPHSPGKIECLRKSLELYEKAGRHFEPALERVELPYGNETIPTYLRLTHDGAKHPVVINFGGLIVNGKDDLQTPIADLYILLEHGTPKSARVFPGGHMGQTPETLPTIIRWLLNELS